MSLYEQLYRGPVSFSSSLGRMWGIQNEMEVLNSFGKKDILAEMAMII